MNIFSAFDTSVMVALLLGIEFLRSDIRTILYCKRNDPRILKLLIYAAYIIDKPLFYRGRCHASSGTRTCL